MGFVVPSTNKAEIEELDPMWGELARDMLNAGSKVNATVADGFDADVGAWRTFASNHADGGSFFAAGTVADQIDSWKQKALAWRNLFTQLGVTLSTPGPPAPPAPPIQQATDLVKWLVIAVLVVAALKYLGPMLDAPRKQVRA